ncbi:MAG: hypothetical protein SVR81_06335 [Chloroflexota bacterium]|nr:hypothetical protein [Chloroflexota bacterium]
MRKYAKDYEIGTERDKKGREKKVSVYVGKFFDVSLNEVELKRFRRISMLLLGLIFLAQIAGGFVSNLGMYAFFVALPYVGTFLPIYFLAMSVFRIPRNKWNYRREEVELSFKRIKTHSMVLLILASLGLIGEVVFLIWFANGSHGREWIYLGLEVLLVALSVIWVYIQRDIKIIPIADEAVRVVEEVDEEGGEG